MDTESALVVPVPAATLVEPFRDELDSSAALGVPAHVTVLYPFIAPELVDGQLNAVLTDLFASIAPFSFELAAVGWFGTEVLWLRPEPDEPFRRLTVTVTSRWPHLPPYGGIHEEVVPHLTIGDPPPAPRLEEAARLVSASLPITCVADEVWLMAGSDAPGSWTVRSRFPHGGAEARGQLR